MILNDNDQFGKVLKRIMLDYLLIQRCDTGINKITICPDGMIYPYDNLVGVAKENIGSIDSDLLNNLYYINAIYLTNHGHATH